MSTSPTASSTWSTRCCCPSKTNGLNAQRRPYTEPARAQASGIHTNEKPPGRGGFSLADVRTVQPAGDCSTQASNLVSRYFSPVRTSGRLQSVEAVYDSQSSELGLSRLRPGGMADGSLSARRSTSNALSRITSSNSKRTRKRAAFSAASCCVTLSRSKGVRSAESALNARSMWASSASASFHACNFREGISMP